MKFSFSSIPTTLDCLNRSGNQARMVAMMLVSGMIISSCRQAPVRESAGVEPIGVKVVPVLRQDISVPVRSAGYVATGEEVRLSFKTGGIVSRTHFREGDAVKKGQVMATLNLTEINAQVDQARNGLEKAKRDLERAKNLYADSVATLEQFQNAETFLNVAKSIYDAAAFNLANSRIVAPQNGIVLRQLVKENELAAPGYPVYALGISGKNWVVRTSLSDRDFVKIHIGDSAVVRLDAWPDETFRAVVSQIDEASNPQTGTYEIELQLAPTSLRLAYGFIAHVEITPDRRLSCYLIPMASVVEASGSGGYVYEVTPEGRAHKIKIEIATLSGNLAAVTAGLENTTSVVSEGAAYLAEGQPVTIKNN